MGKKEKGTRNPTDKFRKKERQRELKKNKEKRKTVRDTILEKKDPTLVMSQIQHYAQLESQGKADKAMKQKKQLLLGEYYSILRVQKEVAERKVPTKEEYEQSRMIVSTKSLVEIEKENQVKYPNPENSIYYHPTLNPYGAPPPGAAPAFRDGSSANRLMGEDMLSLTYSNIIIEEPGVPPEEKPIPQNPESSSSVPPLDSLTSAVGSSETKLKKVEKPKHGISLLEPGDLLPPLPNGPPPYGSTISFVHFPPMPPGSPPQYARLNQVTPRPVPPVGRVMPPMNNMLHSIGPQGIYPPTMNMVGVPLMPVPSPIFNPTLFPYSPPPIWTNPSSDSPLLFAPKQQEEEEIVEDGTTLVPVALRVRRQDTQKSKVKVNLPATKKENKDEAYDLFMKDMKSLGAL